jgi:diaminohydroxyphosphoribosylaminopyrimidine deaminase/5-amino-6-(5-phosphoribosylamino)uracil reductase
MVSGIKGIQMSEKIPENWLTEGMYRASAEARKWLGATSPNPAVGAAALGAEGEVLATAAHERAGEAHAEAKLIENCRAQNLLGRIHTLCVTLEPCNHQGRTPPCTEAIIRSGIKSVAIGARDLNPKVAGGGIERLTQAGLNVSCGINEEECRQLITPFSYNIQSGKSWITIKRALDRHGSMIPPPGQKTFTSTESLKLVHRLRKKCDAIVTGSGTILADDPLFTVRYVPDFLGKRRLLAIIDRHKRVPENFISAASLRGFDSTVFDNVDNALEYLAHKEVQDVLVEAGPQLSQAMFDSHLWCMSVTISEGDPDRIDVSFNPREPIPFARGEFRWEWFLPT